MDTVDLTTTAGDAGSNDSRTHKQHPPPSTAAAARNNPPPPPAPPAAAAKPSYKPPTIQRALRKVAPPHDLKRFESDVIGGRLWYEPCQSAVKDINDTIPLSFPSVEDYIATFVPLVLEEAREAIKTDWAENCAAGKIWPVNIQKVEESRDVKLKGWYRVHVVPSRPNQHAHELHSVCQNRINNPVVLTLGAPPLKNPLDWLMAGEESSGAGSKVNTYKNSERRGNQYTTADAIINNNKKKNGNDSRSIQRDTGTAEQRKDKEPERKKYRPSSFTSERSHSPVSTMSNNSNESKNNSNSNSNPTAAVAVTLRGGNGPSRLQRTANATDPLPPQQKQQQQQRQPTPPTSTPSTSKLPKVTVVAGIIRQVRREGQEIVLEIHPCCHHHNKHGLENPPPCKHALEALKRGVLPNNNNIIINTHDGRERKSASTSSTGSGQGGLAFKRSRTLMEQQQQCSVTTNTANKSDKSWHLAMGGMLVTSMREYDAVHQTKLQINSNLVKYILKPQLLKQIAAPFEQDPLLKSRMWPTQARTQRFIQYLRAQYDVGQLTAIEMAACHLGSLGSSTGGTVVNSDGGTAGVMKTNNNNNNPPTLPFILIQGPPGTGKTHTVKGVLNVWHLVAYQRFYSALNNLGSAYGIPTGSNRSGGDMNKSASASASSLPMVRMGGPLLQLADPYRPRLLVCTPSNAACDEILQRIIQAGFKDGGDRQYRPILARVGADVRAVNPAVRSVWVGTEIERYKGMSQGEWQLRIQDIQSSLARIDRELEQLVAKELVGWNTRVARAVAASSSKGGNTTTTNNNNNNAARATAEQVWKQRQPYLDLFVKLLDDRLKLQRQYDRLEASRDLVWKETGSNIRKIERQLETVILSQAEMVFTTLSSTQRASLQEAAKLAPFDTILIDEAGQASEAAALQPLVFGAKRVVLVGDPQQLPATVLSEAAREVELERSLFERLQQQGCPVNVLTVQYRMHPDIRSFPSQHFYDNKLQDAPSIRDRPDEPFYSHQYLKPYLFFDVAHGVEKRQAAGGSVGNAAEAEMAVALFHELRRYLERETQRGGGGGGGGVNQRKPLPHPQTKAREILPPQQKQKQPPGAPDNTHNSNNEEEEDDGLFSRGRKLKVGIITPYKEQRSLIRSLLKDVFGDGDKAAAEVMTETIDSFQGKQADVIILSCVRAPVGSSSSGENGAAGGSGTNTPIVGRNKGLGFVTDVRRMNVAITRAQRALWVVGNADTLKASAEWRALIQNAEKRRLLVRRADPRKMFPNHPWREFDDVVEEKRRRRGRGRGNDEGEGEGEGGQEKKKGKGDRTKEGEDGGDGKEKVVKEEGREEISGSEKDRTYPKLPPGR
jgi:hypothetical protein